jgi:CHRD domain
MQRFKGSLVSGLANCAAIAAIALTNSAMAHERSNSIEVRLKSYQEVPPVSSPATGRFEATYDEASATISYELSYSGLEGDVRQAHIHFGQHGVNGAIMVWLCQSATNVDPTGLSPQCPGPNAGTVRGLIQSANVICPANTCTAAAPFGQGIANGEFEEFVKAIRAGVAYVNVHSSRFPGGELRGQLRGNRGHHD